MKRILLIAALCLSLGACGTTNPVTDLLGIVTGAAITPDQAYIAANAFDAVEATATQYLTLPACVTGGSAVCRTQTAVNALVPAIRLGRTARNNLEAAVNTSGGAPVSVSLYTALEDQTSTLQAIVAQYNIGSK